MKTIDVNATNSTPAVIFGEDNILSIKGRSIPANESKFYNPLIEWAKKVTVSKLIVDLNLEYMNSGSSKMLLYLLKTLDTNTSVEKLIVKWYYEAGDESTYECGKIFKEMLRKAEFRFCRYRDA
jgi:hypothetical protein